MSLDAILGHIGSAILVAIPFLLVYALVIREVRRRRDRQAALAAIAAEMEALREKIEMVTTPGVPGRHTATDLGPVTAEGSAGAGFLGVAEKRAMILLMRRALALGADALVEVRHERGAVRTGVVRLAGRAVTLSEKGQRDPSL
ncbi:MAG: hypothetical protein MUF17_05190 [Syntrophales bacterium]|jgi:uncharacterized protein YbjQ (UPF0145 family)|nr:hypothetical protein [Syntrophales bacterium]MCU0554150.1 hypothetical protein [Syntrophales bacterium]